MERASRRPGTIRLELGEPDFPTPRHIVDAAAEAARSGQTRYAPGRGIAELREAAALKLQVVNEIDVRADQVVVTAGAINGILLALVATTRVGDTVAIPDPGWPNYCSIAHSLGLNIVRYPLGSNSGAPDPELVARLLRARRVRALVINSPSNPTGSIWNRSALEAVLGSAAQEGTVVISDECYDQIVFEGNHTSPASLNSAASILSVFSFSKTYAMTGWRVGYLCAPRALIDDVATLQEAWNSCCNTVSQWAALAALTGPQACVGEMVNAYRLRRDVAMTELAAHELSVWRPDGAFYLMVDVETEDSEGFAVELIDSWGVAVAPGAAFGSQAGSMIRLSLASSDSDLLAGIGQIARALEQAPLPPRGQTH